MSSGRNGLTMYKLEDGQIFIEKDIQKLISQYIISTRSLRINDLPREGQESVSKARGDHNGFKPTDREETDEELHFLHTLRRINSGSEDVPVPPDILNRILECLSLVGIDSKLMKGLITGLKGKIRFPSREDLLRTSETNQINSSL